MLSLVIFKTDIYQPDQAVIAPLFHCFNKLIDVFLPVYKPVEISGFQSVFIRRLL